MLSAALQEVMHFVKPFALTVQMSGVERDSSFQVTVVFFLSGLQP
jgi:hypothetical protein